MSIIIDGYPEDLQSYGPVKTEYPHTIFGGIINSFAEYLKDNVFQRANTVTISTYSKTIQRFKNRKLGGEGFSPKFPFLVIDPMYDFQPEQYAGKFLHQFFNKRLKFGAKLYEPVLYSDDHFELHPMLNRYKGSIEATLWCGSVSELMDMRMDVFQRFNGVGRVIYPKYVECLAVLPDALQTTYVTDPETGERVYMDLDSDPFIEEIMIKSIGKPKYTIPFGLKPWFILNDVSDGSDKYGGGDSIADHRMTVSIDWECNIPTHFILIKKSLPEPLLKIELVTNLTSFYFQNEAIPGIFIGDEISSVSYVKNSETVDVKDLVYDYKYNYVLDENDVNLINTNGIIEIPINRSLDGRYVKIYSKNGMIDGSYDYNVYGDSMKIKINAKFLNGLNVDDVLILVYYKDMPFRT